MMREIEATCWCLCECIRVGELAATHRLERIRRFRMFEKKKAWKGEAGVDRIEIIAKMREQLFLTGFDSESLYSKLYNPRWPHILRMKNVLSQPAPPPQCDSSPRPLPAVDTGSGEPALPRVETRSTESEGVFPLQCRWFFARQLHKPGPGGYYYFLQADVTNDVEITTTTNAQAATREEFARPPKNRQQQRMSAWGNEKTKQFDPGGYWKSCYFSVQTNVCLVYCLPVCLVFLCFAVFLLVCNFPKQIREARRIFYQEWERLGCANQILERASSSRFA